jgi:acid phosphatase (class A)
MVMGNCWVDPYASTQYVYQTPPEGEPPFDAKFLRKDKVKFPQGKWDADFECLNALDEFSQVSDWRLRIIIPDPPAPDSAVTASEIRELVALKAQRQALMPEIQAQDRYFQLYFIGLLTMTERSHPATYLLLKIAARIGETVMSQQKMKFSRARPSQIYPPLAPPLDVANHPSYPSGHSVVSFMMAFAAAEAVQNQAVRASLAALALRIGRLREVAGFHFRSDTAAGQMVAAQAMAIVRTLYKYQAVRNAAALEWQ